MNYLTPGKNVRITFMSLCWHSATGKKLGSQLVVKLRGLIPGEWSVRTSRAKMLRRVLLLRRPSLCFSLGNRILRANVNYFMNTKDSSEIDAYGKE